MTDVQKDAIVKAAQRIVRNLPPPSITCFDVSSEVSAHAAKSAYDDLFFAVRAAEQRWTVEENMIHGPGLVFSVGGIGAFGSSKDMVRRIARLLNEDDAKGGK